MITRILLAFTVYALLTSCSTTNTLGVTSSPVTTQFSKTPTFTPTFTAAPTRATTHIPTNTPYSIPETYLSLAGLFYRTEKGHFWIDPQGVAQFITDSILITIAPDRSSYITSDWDDLYLEAPGIDEKQNLSQSPGIPSIFEGWSEDGSAVFYSEEQAPGSSDLFMLTLASGVRNQLTTSPDSSERLVAIWPGRPELALLSIRDKTIPPAPTVGIQGALYLQNLKTLNLTKIGSENEFDPPSFAPPSNAGEVSDRFAFRDGQQAYIYSLGTGLQPYALTNTEHFQVESIDWLAAPTWSQDGRWLAWQVVYQGKSGWVINDLQSKTSKLIHLFTHTGMGGHLDPAEFSPDSRWLIVNAHTEENDLSGAWLYQLDEEKSYRLPGDAVLFSPDGFQILVMNHRVDPPTLTLVMYDTWEIKNFVLPGIKDITAWK